MTALTAVLRGVSWFHHRDNPASVFSFAQESLSEVSPACVENALGEPSPYHPGDDQVFQNDTTKPSHERMNQLVEVVFSLVGYLLRVASQHPNRFPSVRSLFFSAVNATVQASELALRTSIPAWVVDPFSRGKRDQTVQADIQTNFLIAGRQRLSFHPAGKEGVPPPGLADHANRLDLAFQGTMPANRNPTNPRQLQSSSVQLETVTVLLQTEGAKPSPALEAGIARLFPQLESAKEGVERLVQIGDNHLQDVTVNGRGILITGLKNLDLSQLNLLADPRLVAFIGQFLLFQTAIVETPTGFQSGLQKTSLRTTGIESTGEGLKHQTPFWAAMY